MSFLIDTDTVSAHLRGHAHATSRFAQYSGRLYLSTVTLAELKTWLYRSNTPIKYRTGLQALLRDARVLPVDDAVADQFGVVGAGLLDQGITVATPDLLIAATALVHGFTVVTHNVSDFSSVPGLAVLDWLQP